MLMCDVDGIVLVWHLPILFATCIITKTLNADLVRRFEHRRRRLIEFSSVVPIWPVSVCLTEPIKLLIHIAVLMYW